MRSTVEYGSVVWDPHTSKDKDEDARMVSNDYGRHSSVTSMLTRLGWATLEQRRENQRLTMMHKVVHGLVAVPSTHLTAADSRSRANHSFKFRSISCNSTPYKYPSFREPFLLGTSYQQKPPKLRPSMHSSIVFRSSTFHLHRCDIPSGSLPITFQIQIQPCSGLVPGQSPMGFREGGW